jgi:hypothetical protein
MLHDKTTADDAGKNGFVHASTCMHAWCSSHADFKCSSCTACMKHINNEHDQHHSLHALIGNRTHPLVRPLLSTHRHSQHDGHKNRNASSHRKPLASGHSRLSQMLSSAGIRPQLHARMHPVLHERARRGALHACVVLVTALGAHRRGVCCASHP